MKTNYHTHTTWCDGKDSPEAVVLAAIEKGLGAIGFSSHAMLPEDDTPWVLTPEKAPRYAAEIRALAKKYEGRIRILCGVEADYVPGGATPDRRAYAAISPDYIIGSVHFVVAPDGARVSVDESPESLADGIRRHFGGDAEAYLHAYFAQVREMLLSCDFDVHATSMSSGIWTLCASSTRAIRTSTKPLRGISPNSTGRRTPCRRAGRSPKSTRARSRAAGLTTPIRPPPSATGCAHAA